MSIKKGLILFTALAFFFMVSSCNDDVGNNNNNNCIKGEGTITTSTLQVSDFTGIDLALASDVTITQGTTQKVEATGHPNIIDLITTNVSNGIWSINLESPNCYEDYELSIAITISDINQLTLSGSGNLIVNDFSNQSELSMNLEGSGNITLGDFNGATELNSSLSGSGNININAFDDATEFDITLSGSGNFIANSSIDVASLNLVNSGNGNFRGFEIDGNNSVVSSKGSGYCELTASSTLDVTISGSGNVSYKGMPTITQNITGSGSLIDAN